jgi:hypothetical protein
MYSFQSKALQNLPKLGFLVWKETIWQPWRLGWKKDNGGNRVTRFEEFSPNWIIVYFGQFLKITEVARVMGLLLKIRMHYFWLKLCWATFWAILHKPIWSPWSGRCKENGNGINIGVYSRARLPALVPPSCDQVIKTTLFKINIPNNYVIF